MSIVQQNPVDFLVRFNYKYLNKNYLVLTLAKFNLSVHSEIWLKSQVKSRVVVSGDSPVEVRPHQHRNHCVAHHGWQLVYQEGLKRQLELLGRMEVCDG